MSAGRPPAGPRATINGGASTLREQVAGLLDDYFATLDGELPCDLYEVVIGEVERPLLEGVMRYVGNNQSQAAEVLGMSRGTLRKKLKTHGIL